MTMAERIYHHIQELPDQDQAEVLDFVEFLRLKKRKARDKPGAEASDTDVELAGARDVAGDFLSQKELDYYLGLEEA